MQKIIGIFTVAGIVLLASCTPKAAPTAGTPPPVTEAYGFKSIDKVSTAAADIEAGHVLYTTTCAKCHDAKEKYLTKNTFEESVKVMNNMSKKAKLTQDQVDQLAAYVKSAAKKS